MALESTVEPVVVDDPQPLLALVEKKNRKTISKKNYHQSKDNPLCQN
jgi:hypothetical protein